MERLGWWERALRIRGILMVATEPVAARRRWCLASRWWSEAFRIGLGGWCCCCCGFVRDWVYVGGCGRGGWLSSKSSIHSFFSLVNPMMYNSAVNIEAATRTRALFSTSS